MLGSIDSASSILNLATIQAIHVDYASFTSSLMVVVWMPHGLLHWLAQYDLITKLSLPYVTAGSFLCTCVPVQYIAVDLQFSAPKQRED